MAITWNSADAATITFSNGNLTATSNAAGGGGTRATVSKSTGKYYFEATMSTWSGTGAETGLATSSATLLGGGLAGQAAVTRSQGGVNGSIYINGTYSGSSLGPRTSGDIIGIASDLVAGLIWFRAAPSGNWNGSGTANPATGVGGISLGALAGSVLFPFFAASSTGQVATANFGASAFSGAVPSGFISWEAGLLPRPSRPPAIRIKRRAAGGAAGAPTSLANGELAYNEQDDTLYYGKGDSGAGVATSIVAIGGVLAAGGGAPVGAEYITSTANATLTAERVLTDTATVTWDRATAGQIKANAAGAAIAPPQRTVFTSGSGTYTTPSGPLGSKSN
jgi:hypothetical protein